MPARKPTNEVERLAALRAFQVLDTDAEAEYDDLAAIASEVSDAPIALVSLLDADRQWFKARVGLECRETPRDQAFCAHAILGTEMFVVPDATADERFRDNPLVVGDPGIRFYAGAPLTTDEGLAIGTLCVIDRTPRSADSLTESQRRILTALARQAVRLLEHRRVERTLAEALTGVKLLAPLVPVCAWCRRIRDDAAYWSTIEEYLGTEAGVEVSHGMCPTCLEERRSGP